MIRGLYTAASGMLAQQHRQDLLTNNLANINTPGYKSKQAMVRAFPEMLINAIRLPNGESKAIGKINQGVFLEEGVKVFLQGDLVDTGVADHMAIWDKDMQVNPDTQKQPKLFFTVEDENGNRFFTRSGLFTEDAAGQLVTPEGHLVLDDWNYPIQANGRSFTMDDRGNINFSDGETVRVGLTKIDDTGKLLNQGNQMFTYDGNVDNLDFAQPEDNYRLFNGKIERSNVDPSQTMVDMMTALRLYEANQKVIQSLDRTLDKAVNEIARL